MRNLIARLTRPMIRMLQLDDRGAFGALIGVLFASGVLLGLAALTIDVGTVYQERAEGTAVIELKHSDHRSSRTCDQVSHGMTPRAVNVV